MFMNIAYDDKHNSLYTSFISLLVFIFDYTYDERNIYEIY